MVVSFAKFSGIVLSYFLIFAASASLVHSAEFDRASLLAAADAGDTAAQRTLGEALLFGAEGVNQEKELGLRLLEQSATGGNIEAMTSLGKVLIDGYYLPADPEKGRQLLEKAATAGNPQAQVTLGEALLWGLNGDVDLVHGRSLLEQAAGNGDIKAMRILGAQLIGGWALEQDVVSGLSMLERAVATGDAEAKVVLGEFFLEGTRVKQDQARALKLFEEAAESGNGEGLETYGTTIMWSERDPAAAENYLRRAGELGRDSAWATLAEGAMYGYLGRNSRAKFDAFAQKAGGAGVDRLAILEAERQMWGISMRASGPRTIAGLEQAAEDGNKPALKYLIALVRNGNQLNIRKNTDQAYGYLDRFSDLLTPLEFAQMSMSIDAAKVKIVAAYKPLAAQFDQRPELKSLWFGEELYAANPNFAIYLLQSDMKRKGIYSGALNGLATQLTLRAIDHECRTLKDDSKCNDSIMRPDVIGALLAR